jgi:hypothetical protein
MRGVMLELSEVLTCEPERSGLSMYRRTRAGAFNAFISSHFSDAQI